MNKKILSGVAVGIIGALAFAGCSSGSDDEKKDDNGGSVDTALQELFPQDIRDAGQIKVATSIYPPVDYYEEDGTTLVGFDHDLLQAVGERVGLEIDWNVIDFGNIIPGIESNQYQMATDINDTKEREEVVDFVTTFRDGTSILVQKGNPQGIVDLDSLCGKTVVVTKGSTQIALLETQQEACKSAGEDAVNVMELPDSPDAMLAMKNARADAYLVNTLAGSYGLNTDENADVELLSEVYDEVYAGMIFPKSSNELRDAIHAAVQALIDDGTYLSIMEKYGVEANAIEESKINAAAE